MEPSSVRESWRPGTQSIHDSIAQHPNPVSNMAYLGCGLLRFQMCSIWSVMILVDEVRLSGRWNDWHCDSLHCRSWYIMTTDQAFLESKLGPQLSVAV